MNNILSYSEPFINKILTGINSKIIIILCIIFIIHAFFTEPSNTLILLFYNKYFIVLYLLLIFFTALYNPVIAILLTIYFDIIINKVIKFYVKPKYKTNKSNSLLIEYYITSKKDEFLGGRKNSVYLTRNPLSYFLY